MHGSFQYAGKMMLHLEVQLGRASDYDGSIPPFPS